LISISLTLIEIEEIEAYLYSASIFSYSDNFIDHYVVFNKPLGVILPESPKNASSGQIDGNNKQSVRIVIEEWENPAVSNLPQGQCPLSEQCVNFAEELLEHKLYGHAYQIRPTHYKNPKTGDGILFYSQPWGHIGIIWEITSDAYVVIEKNVEGCGVVSTRSIQFDDWRIKGFVE